MIDASKLNDLYNYEASLLRIIDGDTVDIEVNLGFDVRMKMRCRLYGINAPEMNTQAGKDAKAHLEMLLLSAFGVKDGLDINTIRDKKDKYGRYLVVIYYGSSFVNDKMVQDGHAVEYMI